MVTADQFLEQTERKDDSGCPVPLALAKPEAPKDRGALPGQLCGSGHAAGAAGKLLLGSGWQHWWVLCWASTPFCGQCPPTCGLGSPL